MSSESLLKGFPHSGGDSLEFDTSANAADEDVQDYLIFLLPGNPGVIHYYEPFLSKLRSLLDKESSANSRFHICGHSYKGFELSPAAKAPAEPVGLKQQIEYQEQILSRHVKEYQKNSPGKALKVILIGHSVGSYVLLELIQRHARMVKEYDDVNDFDLIGGVLLFPTIAEIGQSPLGRIAKVVLPFPGFARMIGAIAWATTNLLPDSALGRVIEMATRFPDHAAKITTFFLKSPLGVRQALHLALDEMRMIKDQWDSEVWDATTSPGTNKRDTINNNLVLFWGKKDQWVADATRDNIIKAHSQQGRTMKEDCTPEMIIDDRGTRHDFCTNIESSDYVAGRVQDWIDSIIKKHSKMMRRTSTYGKPLAGGPA